MEVSGAAVLRAARLRSGLSQAEVGARAGVPQSVVSAYERERRDPTVATLRRLVAAAGFDLDVELVPRVQPGPSFTGPVGRRLQRRRDEARLLLHERGYTGAAVFGSVARGEDGPESDLDLLVDPPREVSLTQLARTAIDLESLIGVRVDLVPRSGLRPRVARAVADDLVPL